MALLDNDTQISVLVEGLDHPEGVAWGLDGYAYAGGEAGQLYRIDIERRELREMATTGGFILGIALDSSNNLYACDIGNLCVQKITPGGMVSTYSSGAPDEPFLAPNYPAFDAEGNLYVADSGDWKADNGVIWKIRSGLTIPLRSFEWLMGLYLSKDGALLMTSRSLLHPCMLSGLMILMNILY